ncbi:kinase-like protein [Canariomyces notabilis]|uniref:Kinase-like protein n=1 Tax=Canariomyces notabilis TaxID=2074819 RepID=A0AAN6T948_9PEZI|nr:kinase-like protein [Canariomyces arenarius]
MPLSDKDAEKAIRARYEPLARTAFSIIYTEKGNTESVLKAGGFWIDGEVYDKPAFAENTSDHLKREVTVYDALRPHPHITACLGLELLPGTSEAWALRLERSPWGDLRSYILKHTAPDMCDRLKVAVDFATAVQHLHDRGVIWGDLSTRNAIVFDGLNIKLCDFSGSSLRNPRYWPPMPVAEAPADGSVELELFALGTAICEITEWAVPYGRPEEVDEDAVQRMLARGEYPHVSDDNPARDVIWRLWRLEYRSGGDAVKDLKAILNSLALCRSASPREGNQGSAADSQGRDTDRPDR